MSNTSYLSEAEYGILTQDWDSFKRYLFGSKFTVEDLAVSGLIGIVAAACHELTVMMPNSTFNKAFKEKHPDQEIGTDGILTKKVNHAFNVIYDKDTISSLERKHKASFDGIRKGLSGSNHRVRTPGHDPIYGLYFGVKDIQNGEITYLRDGRFCVEKSGVDPVKCIFLAIKKWAGHMASDVNTTQGLPIPGSSFIDWLANDQFMERVYRSGVDLRHLLSQSIPVFISDILLRIYCVYKGYAHDLKDAFSLTPNPKIRRLLLLMHVVNLSANLLITYYLKGGNISNINWSAVIAVGWYGVQELFHCLVGRWKDMDQEIERRDKVLDGWVRTIHSSVKETIIQSDKVSESFDATYDEFLKDAEELAILLGKK